MHPQRTLIEAAQRVFLNETLEKIAGPNVRHWTMVGKEFKLGPEDSSHKEHGDVFPGQSFTGLSDNEKRRELDPAPPSRTWGRYDTKAHEFHMITQSGMTPHGIMGGGSSSRINRDIDTRLDALSSIERHFKDHPDGLPNISHGIDGQRNPQSIESYRRQLMKAYEQ